jgi:hypothetical protein
VENSKLYMVIGLLDDLVNVGEDLFATIYDMFTS